MIGPLKLFPDPNSPLNGANAAYLEGLYNQYLSRPDSVDGQWRSYFESLDQLQLGEVSPDSKGMAAASMSESAAAKQSAVLRMINAYRVRAHQNANTDPLNFFQRDVVPDLEPEFQGFTEPDLELEFDTGSLAVRKRMRLSEILDALRGIYCGTIGIEYYYITNTKKRRWIQARVEPTLGNWSA